MELQSKSLSDLKVFAFGALGAMLSLLAAIAIRLGIESVPAYVASFKTQILMTSLIYAVSLYACGVESASSRPSYSLWAVSHVLANSIAWLVSLAFVYLQGLDRIGRGIFMLFGVLHPVMSGAWYLARTRLSDHWLRQRRVLIAGCGAAAEMVAILLRNSGKWRLYPVALLQLGEEKTQVNVENLPVYTGHATLFQTAKMVRAEAVVLASPQKVDDDLVMELLRCRFDGLEVMDGGELYEAITGRIPLSMIEDYRAVFVSLSKIRPINPTLKRLMDLVFATGLVMAAAPVMGVIALLIKIFSPGPVFYRQERLGQDGKPFHVVKFRTMILDAEAVTGAVWAAEDDPRITGVGRFFRKWRLDELPQLFNVLRGEMSLVGPRPEREIFVSDFLQEVPVFRPGRRGDDAEGTYVFDGWREAINLYPTRLMVKPGVTGWAQVNRPYAASFEETREKLEYDLSYIKNQSVLLDLSILLRTLAMLVCPRGR